MSNLTHILLVLVERRQLDRFCLQLCNKGQFLIGVSSQMGSVLDWPHCIGFCKQKEIPTVVALGGWRFQNVSNGFSLLPARFSCGLKSLRLWDDQWHPNDLNDGQSISLHEFRAGKRCRILGPKSLQHDLTISSWTYGIVMNTAWICHTFTNIFLLNSLDVWIYLVI